MKALIYPRYGGPEVLEVADVPMPVPGAGEALIRVEAAGLNPSDNAQRSGAFKFFMNREFPKRLGLDVAGVVVELGIDVTHLKVGMPVFGMTSNVSEAGTAAEFVTLKADVLAERPAQLSPTEAAAVPLAAQTALQALVEHGRLQAGQRVLINGASGGVGLFAVQMARLLGAHVTGVCSERSAALVREFGAHEVIDYATTDVRRLKTPFDVFFDARGGYRFGLVRGLLGREGRFVSIAPSFGLVLSAALSQGFGRKRISAFLVESRRSDMEQIASWLETGELRVRVERTYRLEAAAEAYRHLETKRVQGKLVFTLGD